MRVESRKFSLGIWGLALGYFIFYIPYSGLIKALTTGVISGRSGPASGFELLPMTTIATAITMLLIITAMGWWRYAGRRICFGRSLPFPSRLMILSGLGTAMIIGTTTLAYTFSGISIVFALILLRGGVLIIAPLVDRAFKRRVRWFSWTALMLSFTALVVALTDVSNYQLSLFAALNIIAYLTGYLLRLPCMTALAKSEDKNATRRYFVEEQMVALPLLVVIPAIFALLGKGDIMMDLRHGFTPVWSSSYIISALIAGSLYAGLCFFGTLIYLDRRENTFCIPLNRSSSLLSGVVASYGLFFLYNQKLPSTAQLASVALITVALLFLSPLHHLRLSMSKLYSAFAQSQLASQLSMTNFNEQARSAALASIFEPHSEERMASSKRQRILLFVCSGNTCRSAMAEAIGKAEIAARFAIPFASIASSGIKLLSAGVSAQPGKPMTPEAQQTLRHLGVPVPPHATRLLTVEMVNQAEVIYCMTQAHCRAVIERFPSAATKTMCLDPDGDIDDPIGAAWERFLSCGKRIQDLVRWRFEELGLSAGLVEQT
jgi:protein-tyrosine-phosphatase